LYTKWANSGEAESTHGLPVSEETPIPQWSHQVSENKIKLENIGAKQTFESGNDLKALFDNNE